MEYPVYESSREISLCIPMEDIMSVDLHTFIEERVKKEVETLHNGEGIILPDTLSILTRSPLRLNPKDSTYTVIVRYMGQVVDVPSGSEVNAVVEGVLSSGLLCHVYDPRLPNPLVRAYVPIAIHTSEDQERITSIQKDDIVRIRSINRKGSYADKIITMIGMFVDLVSRPKAKTTEPGTLPAPANETKYDAGGDGDPLGPQADGMSPPLPIEKSGVGAGASVASAAAAAAINDGGNTLSSSALA
jgi:hypothetical protein